MRTLSARFRRVFTQLSYLPQTFKLIWSASHIWTVLWVVVLIGQGVLPGAIVYLTRTVVDSLVSVVGAGVAWSSVQPVLLPGGLMVGALLLGELLRSLGDWIRTIQSELVQDHISGLVHEQSISVDLAFYESSEFYDHLNRARSDASGRSLALLENMGGLLQNSITLITMAAVLLPYGVWLPVVLFASALPAFLAMIKVNRRQHHWWQRTTQDRRWLQYYEILMTEAPVAPEIRLFGLGPYFKGAYKTLRRRLRREQLALVREQSIARLGATTLALVISGGALAWMGRQVLLGAMTLGDLALFYQAFNRSQGMMRALLGNLSQVYNNSLFISNLFEFLRLRPEVVSPPDPHPVPTSFKQGIRFRDVTFYYPGSDRPVLERFNLTIPAGKIVAIVGDNGAGKSTLIKLLCRFYDPQAGAVELDQTDIRQFSIDDLRRQITVLFQEPIPYYVSAAQNIALGDLSMQATQEDIEAAAHCAGVHDTIMQLPNGYDSKLGKLFPNGTELSGGQWQRLALARSFLRRAELIILDEPTSAMDPWAEMDWVDRFRQLASGRTAVVITHRFPLAMSADIIHVMRNGSVVESGNHEELLARGGLYAESWRAQMRVAPEPELASSS